MFSSDFSDINDAADPGHARLPAESGRADSARLAGHPILDLAEFQVFEDQLDNPRIARSFASDFAKLWRVRYQTLATAVERGDVAAALDAILSLRTSSSMLGGTRLAVLAARVEEHVNTGDLRSAQPLLNDLSECGELTVQELKASYVLRNASPEPDPSV